MKRTEVELSPGMAHEIGELRNGAAAAQSELRTLKDLEMGWIAGGDGMPVWPY